LHGAVVQTCKSFTLFVAGIRVDIGIRITIYLASFSLHYLYALADTYVLLIHQCRYDMMTPSGVNPMSFDEKYQLLELAGNEGAKTFVAQEISTGKKVTVFLFVGEQARVQRGFFMQLQEVDRARFPELIEAGDNRGTPYAVTEPVSSLAELKNHLLHLKAAPPEVPSQKQGEFSKAGVWQVPTRLQSPPEGSAKVSQESFVAETRPKEQTAAHSTPDSFTQMFQAPAAPIGESLPELPKAQTPPEAPLPVQSAPGSFTQMFQATAAPMGEPVPEMPKAPKPPPAPTPARTAPGSFTQMFQPAAAPMGEPAPEVPKAPTPPPAPTSAQPAPGSFTQMFQAASAPIGEPADQVPKASTPPVPPKQAQSGPGEFTRFFSAASSSAPAPPPMSQKPESRGEFERVFGSGDRATAPATTVTGIFGQPSSVSTSKQNEITPASTPPQAFAQPAGEFTKIFGDTATEIPTLGPMAPPPAPSAVPPAASSPGEYTRMFSAQPLPQEPLAEPAPTPIGTPEARVPSKQSSKMIPVLIGIILLLLAAIAVIVITMRK
jgi:hypothetical protein